MSAYDPAVYSNVVVLHYVRANSEHFCYAALESFKDGEQCNGMHGDCATLSMPLGTTPMCHTQAHVMCLFAWQGIVSHASTFRRLKNSTLAIALSSQTRSRIPQNFLKTGCRSLTWPKSKIWQLVARPAPPTLNNLGLTCSMPPHPHPRPKMGARRPPRPPSRGLCIPNPSPAAH